MIEEKIKMLCQGLRKRGLDAHYVEDISGGSAIEISSGGKLALPSSLHYIPEHDLFLLIMASLIPESIDREALKDKLLYLNCRILSLVKLGLHNDTIFLYANFLNAKCDPDKMLQLLCSCESLLWLYINGRMSEILFAQEQALNLARDL